MMSSSSNSPPCSTCRLAGSYAARERRRLVCCRQRIVSPGPRLRSASSGEAGSALSDAAYRLGDYELATRLSFFLWGRGPDATLLKAAGQGALALEIHSSLAEAIREQIASLDDPVARAESQAERGFLGTLEAGCTSPVGARSIVKSVRGTSLDLTLAAVIGRTLLSNLSEPTKTGLVVGPSGVLRWEAHGSTDDPAHFGASQAIQVLSELRDPQGPRR